MAVQTIRTAGLRAATASTMSSILPEAPPMKTASGAGQSARASGANPWRSVTLPTWNARQLPRVRSSASGLPSTANTRPAWADSASSTVTGFWPMSRWRRPAARPFATDSWVISGLMP